MIAIAVGAALLAFILGDFLNSSYSILGKSQFEMGEINGQSISYQDFQEKVNERENFIKLANNSSSLDGDMSDQIREYVWEEMVRENVIGVVAEKLGIITTDDGELSEDRVRAIIDRAFDDSTTAPWFADENIVYTERTIIALDHDLHVNRRPDRIVRRRDGEIIVIDYKTGKRDPDHREQVLQYMRLLADMGHDRVDGWVWYINDPDNPFTHITLDR